MKTTSVLTALGATIIGSRAVMNKTFRIETLLAASIAVLLPFTPALSPVSSFAIDITIFYNYNLNDEAVDGSGVVTDPNASGTLEAFFRTGTDPNTQEAIGITFSGPMPRPKLIQKDTFNPGLGESFDTNGVVLNGKQVNAVGFANRTFGEISGSPFGFYMGWSDPNGNALSVTLPGDDLDPNGNPGHVLTFDLRYRSGDKFFWEATQFDNINDIGSGGFDVVMCEQRNCTPTQTNSGRARWAGWVGDLGAGHRHTGDSRQHVADLTTPDIFIQNNGNQPAGSGLDGSGVTDKLGVNFGLRNYDDATGLGGAIYLGDIKYGGRLFKNALRISPQIVFPGDVDLDGDVDIDDFDIILANFNTSVDSVVLGDLTGDGFVDTFDFALWKAEFVPPLGGIIPELASVPEPSTAVLVILFTAVCALRRRRAHGSSD